ncbi:MAG TPA: TonB-dependent receptor, partial [Gammaproteobacteria bacterium]|nr:TonB-dependent receptor [Gammaproteobacteria bacterium]
MQNNTRIAAIAASLSTLLVVLPTASLADQIQTAADDISDNRVIVTATRTATNIDQVLATSMLITRKEIRESQALSIAEILRTRTGIDIASNGGPGQT